MRNGSYAAHLLRVRSRYQDSRDCLIAALRRNFGDVRRRAAIAAGCTFSGICRRAFPMR